MGGWSGGVMGLGVKKDVKDEKWFRIWGATAGKSEVNQGAVFDFF
jgi:hypothetical protein